MCMHHVESRLSGRNIHEDMNAGGLGVGTWEEGEEENEW